MLKSAVRAQEWRESCSGRKSIWVLKLLRQWFSDLKLYVARKKPKVKMRTPGQKRATPEWLARKQDNKLRHEVEKKIPQIVQPQFSNIPCVPSFSPWVLSGVQNTSDFGISAFLSSKNQADCSLAGKHLINKCLTSKIWLPQSFLLPGVLWSNLLRLFLSKVMLKFPP